VHTRDDRDRISFIDRDDQRGSEVQTEIGVAARNRLGLADTRFRKHIADIGKAL